METNKVASDDVTNVVRRCVNVGYRLGLRDGREEVERDMESPRPWHHWSYALAVSAGAIATHILWLALELT